MTNTLRALLILWCAPALADVDAHFANWVAGYGWGTSLQQIQAKYPGGFAWPNKGSEAKEEVVYAVSGSFALPGVETPSPLVQFIFSKDNELQRVFFHFKPADRDTVLYQIAQQLGQDYLIRDQAMSRQFEWKRGRMVFARYEIGSGPEFPWAFLGIKAMNDQKQSQK
jgi:hypothetical protein